MVLGKRMEDQLRFAVCYWHSFCWPGSDMFGARHVRPARGSRAPIDARRCRAKTRRRVRRSSRSSGAPFLLLPRRRRDGRGRRRCASTPRSFADASSSGLGRQHGSAPACKLLWGTANLFSHPRYMAGAGDQSRSGGVRLRRRAGARCASRRRSGSAARTTCCGAGARATTRCSTPTCSASSTSSAASCQLVVEHKHRIGFTGTILIEPKPHEPTKHQYDFDTADGVRLPAAVRAREGGQGQHRSQPRDAGRPHVRARDRDGARATASSARSTSTAAIRRTAGTPTSSPTIAHD